MPIVLKIRFVDVVEVVHLELQFLLCKTGYISQQQIRIGIARRVRATVARISETQDAVRAGRRLREFVFMRIDKVHSKLQVMGSDDLSNIVAKGDRRIRIQRAFGNVTWVFGEVILRVDKADARHLGSVKAKAVVKQAKRAERAAALPGSGQVRRNVIGGIAGVELIEQRREKQSR